MQNEKKRHLMEREAISNLVEILKSRGYQVIAPVVREGGVVYDQISSAAELPVGWIDEQEAGKYRLTQSGDRRLFGHIAGIQSWKQFLHPPKFLLFRSHRENGRYRIETSSKNPKLAFIGVRACELKAIAVQDRVFLGGTFRDHAYETRRKNVFIVAVNCTRAGGTCFCSSMKTGPGATSGFDLALTELPGPKHAFVVETGSDAGEQILEKLPHRVAEDEECTCADEMISQAAQQMGRALNTDQIQALLYRNYDHQRWEQVASRCLSCANCTMVCPTCFCGTVEDVTDLTGDIAERWHRWDSCFTMDFSYIHGGTVRSSVKSRYRQWLTHKLATWIEQFGTSGCVGCGRCITWCPVGIDLTEEVAAIRETDSGAASAGSQKESKHENNH